MNLNICPDSIPQFLGIFDLTPAPALLYYAYIPVVVVSLFFGFYIFVKDKYSLQSKLFLGIAVAFSLWIADLFAQWILAYVNIDVFAWQMTPFFEIFIPILSLYFVDVFLEKRDVHVAKRIIYAGIIAAVTVLVPTHFNVESFDYANCQANFGRLYDFIYVLEVVAAFWLGYRCFQKYRVVEKSDKAFRRQIVILGIGSVTFMLVFALTNILGEITKFYEINLFGPIGMVAFLGLLSYMIVRFKMFNVKLLATQALVVGIAILIGAQLFFPSSITDIIINAVTLFGFIISGMFLIHSVKREVEQREKIEQLAGGLQKANDKLVELDKQKSEFVSFATHQLRAPLTAMKGYASMLLEGDLGELAAPARDAVTRISDSSKTLANVVDDYLNVSRIELGTMKYSFETIDFRGLIESVIAELKPNIDAKTEVAFSFSVVGEDKVTDGKNAFMINADKDKLKQVIANLVDNSIKYTPRGVVSVTLERIGKVARFMVKDNGVGIAPEVMPKLFSKFTRANNANAVNIHGTGLGLFVAKDMVLAHHGKIWAESEGEGKGSAFIVELATV